MLTAALASRDYEKLRGAFVDRLHQPFRKKLIPFLDHVIAAAESAGALGAFLTMVVFAFRKQEEVEIPAQQIALFDRTHPAEAVL